MAPTSQLGPVLIGTVFNWFLLGTLMIQLYVFDKNQTKKKDKAWLRALVHTVVVVNLFDTVICTDYLWFYTVKHWGDVKVFELGLKPWSAEAFGPACGFGACLVQFTYSWRIWTISRSYAFRALACLAVVLSLMQFGANVATPIYAQTHDTGPELVFQNVVITVAQLAGSFSADSLIAACMLFLLLRARAQTIWTQSQTLYDRLIIITLSTGLLTAVTAGVALALFVHDSSSSAWYTPALLMNKLYGNSFIAALNDRFFRPEEPQKHSLNIAQNPSTCAGHSVGIPTIQFASGNSDRSSASMASFDSHAMDVVNKYQLEGRDSSETV